MLIRRVKHNNLLLGYLLILIDTDLINSLNSSVHIISKEQKSIRKNERKLYYSDKTDILSPGVGTRFFNRIPGVLGISYGVVVIHIKHNNNNMDTTVNAVLKLIH